MAYKTARCTCRDGGKLVFLGHLPDCPEVAALNEPEVLEPPVELTVYLCFMCAKVHLKTISVQRCYGRMWVQADVHYAVLRYELLPD